MTLQTEIGDPVNLDRSRIRDPVNRAAKKLQVGRDGWCSESSQTLKSARVVFRVVRGIEVRVSQGICRLFGSCPLRCKTLVFPGFFAFLANCFGFPARPCTCMLAHAASSSALPCPLVSRPVSRQSRLRTLVFAGKTGGFAAEGVGFELGKFES